MNPFNLTLNRHIVLQYIADNPEKVHRTDEFKSDPSTFYSGSALEFKYGIKAWRRACADLYKADLIKVTKVTGNTAGGGGVSITRTGADALAAANGERNDALYEQLAEDAEADVLNECGVAYDHDVPKGHTECRKCGADVSEWSDEE